MRVAPFLFTSLLCAAGPARAEPPAAAGAPEHVAFRLSFKGIDGCPDDSALKVQVSGWVGYDPFVSKAPGLVKLWLERKGKTFVANFTLSDAEGESGIVTKEDTDCAALFRTLGIAVGITLADSAAPLPKPPPPPEPATLPEPASPPEPRPAPAPVPVPEPAPVAAPEPSKRPVALVVGVDGIITPILLPSVGAGFVPWAALRLRDAPVSIEVGLRATWSVVSAHVGANLVRSTYFSGLLAPCWEGSVLFGCAKLEVGAMRFASDPVQPVSPRADPLTFLAGGRIGARGAFAERFVMRGFFEVAGVPHSPRILDTTAHPQWTTPGYSITFGLGFGLLPW